MRLSFAQAPVRVGAPNPLPAPESDLRNARPARELRLLRRVQLLRGGSTSAGMPKEVQDRMLFDAQAATFFNYLIQKAGVEKGKELVEWDQEGKDPVEFVTRPDVFGPDLEKTEKEWQVWLKSQKAPGPIRIMSRRAPPRRAS